MSGDFGLDINSKSNSEKDIDEKREFKKPLKAGEVELLSPEQVDKRFLEISTPFTVMEAHPTVLSKLSKFRRVLLFLNVPVMVVIPAELHFGWLASKFGDNYDTVCTLLSATDSVLFLESVLLYTVLSKFVSKIEVTESREVAVTHFNTTFLSEKTTLFKPE